MAVKRIDSLPSKQELDVWLSDHGYAFDDVQSLSDTKSADLAELLSFLDIKTVGDLVEHVAVERRWL